MGRRIQGYLLALLSLFGATPRAQGADPHPVFHYNQGTSGDAYQQSQCVLELHIPQGARNYPTVVWLHGGGLTSGQREAPKALLDRGIAVAAVEYRLSPKVKANTCIEDAAAATAWVLKHVAEFGGSPGKVFIGGHSAGGYLPPWWDSTPRTSPNTAALRASWPGSCL
jgi:acetyl esterase/lipase